MLRLSWLVTALSALSLASPLAEVEAIRGISPLPRLVLYFQTTHDARGRPISMLPLVNEKGIALTHLIVCSLHVNEKGEIHLNNYPPSHAIFHTLWNETRVMKRAGVKVMGMVGGAAPGSFTKGTLDGNQATFAKYYGQLRDAIARSQLQGLDIDVEQYMSQGGIKRLIDQLRKDFGRDFIISLAPVAAALRGGGNLSGFDYKRLDARSGSKISFYNGQFYSGFGTMASTGDYESIVSHGFAASRVVAGQLTSPKNGGGYMPYSKLNATIMSLRRKYGQIGGVFGWEYFNSQPDDKARPWKWAQIMTQILRPNSVPRLTINRSMADQLTAAYRGSKAPVADVQAAKYAQNLDTPDVDYYAMVNA
ncbi:hypothetical protein E4U42_006295 [Claviceps africana]|uniref:GH18 domain-containing protein n=1 Tax=Claviceps africana TaxID=83212 RepID=A0A8K0JBD0_9HYPO|nr:hypothetical protein E4U42_006295 [Claviceps africana]